MGAMRSLVTAALVAAAFLFADSASADEPASPSAPPAASLAVPAPPPAVAPAYPPPIGPGYAAPYAFTPAPMAGGPYWTMPPPVPERRSEGMRITGIVLFGVGGLATVAGATIFGLGANCFNEQPAFAEATPRPAPASARGPGGQERLGSARQALNTCHLTTPGLGILVGGIVTAIIGVPIFVIGSRQKPGQPAVRALAPSVRVGAGNAALHWTF